VVVEELVMGRQIIERLVVGWAIVDTLRKL